MDPIVRIMSTNAADKTNISFAVAGDGVPVVLIHGTSGCQQMWDFQLEDYVKSGFQVIALDLRGSGASDAPSNPEKYSVSLMASDVIAVLDNLGIESAHIIGHSLGGAIALQVGLDFPNRVISLQTLGGWARTDEYLRRIFFEPMLNAIDRDDLTNNFRYGLGLVMSPGKSVE